MIRRRVLKDLKSGRSKDKAKNILTKTVAPRYNKSQLPNSSDKDSSNTHFPYIKPSENAELLPLYSSVVHNHSLEKSFGINDLEQLQFELESLLSVSVVRSKLLTVELESLNNAQSSNDQKIKWSIQPSSKKHKKLKKKEKPTRKSKLALKTQTKNFQDNARKFEFSKSMMSKNDVKSKFWSLVDIYCSPISTDDKTYLNELIEETNSKMAVNVGIAGPHNTEKSNLDILQNPNILAGASTSKENLGNSNETLTRKHGYFLRKTSSKSVIFPHTSTLLGENVNENKSVQDKLKDSRVEFTEPACLNKGLQSKLEQHNRVDKKYQNVNYAGELNSIAPQNPNVLARAGTSKENLGITNEYPTKKHGYYLRQTYRKPIIFHHVPELLEENVTKRRSKRLRNKLAKPKTIDKKENQKHNCQQDIEILQKIKLSQHEKSKKNKSNTDNLNRLYQAVKNNLERQKCENKLEYIHNNIMKKYYKLLPLPFSSKKRVALEKNVAKLIQKQKILHKKAMELMKTI